MIGKSVYLIRLYLRYKDNLFGSISLIVLQSAQWERGFTRLNVGKRVLEISINLITNSNKIYVLSSPLVFMFRVYSYLYVHYADVSVCLCACARVCLCVWFLFISFSGLSFLTTIMVLTSASCYCMTSFT